MVRPHLRTNKIVKRKRRLPGGRVSVIFRKKKTNRARCGDTYQVLHGTAYGRVRDLKRLSKSEKRPTRYYGGVLSAGALKQRIINKVYSLINEDSSNNQDVDEKKN